MSVLLIGQDEKAKIKDAITKARANIITWEYLKAHMGPSATDSTDRLMLRDRTPGFERPASEHIMLGTYRAAISFEEQPAGIMRHLSVSSRNKDKVPGPEAMEMICEEFGFSKAVCQVIGQRRAGVAPKRPWRVWLEEFEPGHLAINVVEVVEEG